MTLIVALTLGAAAGCTSLAAGDSASTVATSPAPARVSGSRADGSRSPVRHVRPVRMIAWPGPVEELFVHPLIIDARRAFSADSLGLGFQEYFVTAGEFRRILDQLWRRGWTLVDVHRAAAGTVRVPADRWCCPRTT